MQREPVVITSLQNERVKLIRSLEMRKARRETGLFVAEGASILVTAREMGFVPRMLVVLAEESRDNAVQRGLLAWAAKAGAEVLQVSEAVLAKLAAKDNPQTMMGVFEQRFHAAPMPADLAAADVWVALEDIRDPGNLGTILRTVDAVGAQGVILAGQCCDPYSREAVRATMGSIFAVPAVRMTRDAFIEWCKVWPGDIVGTHLEGREDFRNVSPRPPALLVMGSEGPGMSEDVRAVCTRLVRIPMAGRLDSLNLAVATALTLYQMCGSRLRL